MAEMTTDQCVSLCGGDVRLWVEQEAVHIKAVDKHGDPVELNETEVRRLAASLVKLADAIA